MRKKFRKTWEYRIHVIFKDGTDYMCDWQANLNKMYSFIAHINHHRDDLLLWTIEKGDGVIVDCGNLGHGVLRFIDRDVKELLWV